MDYIQWRMQEQDNAEICLRDYLTLATTKDVLDNHSFVKDIAKDHSCGGFVFTGPSGCGKHTVAAYLIKDHLSDRRKQRFLFLHGEQMNTDIPDAQSCKEYLEALIEDARDGQEYFPSEENGREIDIVRSEGDPYDLCILVEAPQAYAYWPVLRNALYQALCLSKAEDLPFRFFPILISEESIVLPSTLQRYLYTLDLGLPGILQRERFLTGTAGFVFSYVRKETLIEKTEGMSFTQIKNLVRNLSCIAVTRSGEEVEEFIDSQSTISLMRKDSEDGLFLALEQMGKDLSESVKVMAKTLSASVDKLADSLPELTARLAPSTMAVENASSSENLGGDDYSLGAVGDLDVPEDEMRNKLRKELEALPPNKAMVEIYGKERLCKNFPEQAELINAL